jgi:HD-GYP domain-containing protein (c-di-GMP phosphodiesterase class II)
LPNFADTEVMLKKMMFFSIPTDFIKPGQSLDFDIYVNSSSIEGRERYYRAIKNGQLLTKDFYQEHIKKHRHLYVPEQQRKKYFSSIIKKKQGTNERVEAIKNIAIEHMENVFDNGENSESILSHIEKSKDVVELIIDTVKSKSMNDLYKTLSELGYHDCYTYDHSINVCMYSIIFYKFLKPQASRYELTTAGLSGLLHDLGKVKISNKILNNVGNLNEWDFNIIKKHPTYGAELLSSCECEGLSSEMLCEIERVMLEHHENINGTGYPRQKKGDEISFLAKTISIIDFFDAVTTKRSYHEPVTIKDAIALMHKSVGRKIDGIIFNEFRRSIFVLSDGRQDIDIGDDFDPCRPYAELPVIKIPVKKSTISLQTGKVIKEVDRRKKAS